MTAGAGLRQPFRLGVDVSAALNLVASLVKYLGLSALVPAGFAVAHDEQVWPFLVAGAIVSGTGFAVERLTEGGQGVGMREGYLVICLVWIVTAVYGALPYVLAGDDQLGRPVDALFEGMAGFTTAGASVVSDVEALPTSILVWRQLTAWLGGIGVVALGLAVLPRLRVGGRQLLESELSTPATDTISNRIRDTASRFGALYVGLTVVGFVALALPGWVGAGRTMDSFEAFGHILSTLPTAGFSTESTSLEGFAALTQWTIVAIMILGGTNFLLLHRALVRRRVRSAMRDEELRLYLLILFVAGAAVSAVVWAEGPQSGEEAVRAGFFQVTSVVTTTGFFSVEYDKWPLFALMAMALLFFVGGCAGSTAGSIKIVRHLLLARLLGREVSRTVHPELVRPVRLNGTIVDPQALTAVISFVLIYVAAFVAGTGVLALDAAFDSRPDPPALELIFASAACLANAGLGLGAAGSRGSFAAFGDASTVAMTILMFIGRLEILPVVVLLRRSYWRV